MRMTRAERRVQARAVIQEIVEAVPARLKERVTVVYEPQMRGFDRYRVRVHTNRTPGRDGGSLDTPGTP
jgi:hypothetical protein